MLMRVYYLLGKSKLPVEMRGEITQTVAMLQKLKTKEEVLKAAYSIITSRYNGQHIATLTRLTDLFSSGIQDLWNRSGFLHCTNQNYLLHYLLVKSNKFKETDIKAKWTLYWGFSPHQYLSIKLNDQKFINVDAWSAVYGVKFGDYSHWFHTKTKE
jgi:hypothetical protein